MAATSKTLPRDIQSDLHDLADGVGERVAKGEMIEITHDGPNTPHLQSGIKCSCNRYSERKDGNKVVFWNEADPKCEYLHLQPLPSVFVITLP